MSAAIFGANLLEEIHQESLDQLLSSLRHAVDPDSGILLGVPELDQLLNVIHHTPNRIESIHDQNFLPQHESAHIDLDGHLSVAESEQHKVRPPLVEIAHSASSTGKTNLLCHITAVSILPKKCNGKEGTVVWLDSDVAFSATRLYSICLNYLMKADVNLDIPHRNSIVEEALKHVHVFSISSSKQLLSVLENLEAYLLPPQKSGDTQPNHFSAHRPLSLIVLDSATAFYWTDRFDTEIARLEAIRTPGPTSASSTTPVKQPTIITATQILAKLKAVQTKFNTPCIYTTNPPAQHHRHRTSHTRQYPSERAVAPLPSEMDDTPGLSPWTLAATLSLSLTRISVPQFASHMSLDECLRDRAKRQEAVNRNRVRVGIGDEWFNNVLRDREVKDELNKLEVRGTFVMRVDEVGVHFD